jgi:hypothetical protein
VQDRSVHLVNEEVLKVIDFSLQEIELTTAMNSILSWLPEGGFWRPMTPLDTVLDNGQNWDAARQQATE